MLDRSARLRGPECHRRHARSTIFAFLGAWIVVQAILVAFIERDAWLRDPLYADKELKLRHRLAARTTPGERLVSIVVVGSSRVNLAVRGEYLESAFETATGQRAVAMNFGMPAAGPIANLLAVRRLVRSDVCLDLIVLEVLPPLVAGQHGQPPELPNLVPERLLSSEEFLPRRSDVDWSECNRRWWTAELVPWYGLRFQLLGRVVWPWRPWNLQFKSSRDTDDTGWTRSMRECVDRSGYLLGIEQARREHLDSLRGFRCQGPAADAVRETLSECQRRHVRVALLLSPEGSEFRSWYLPEAELEIYRFVGELCREFGVPLIDARRWHEDADFADSHHMLPSAASRFSEKLGREIGSLPTQAWAGRSLSTKTDGVRRE